MSGRDLFARVVVPVAEADDGRRSGRAIAPYLGPDARVWALHVVEKAGGAADKASVEQREAVAREAFEAFRAGLGDVGNDVRTEVRYGTDVADEVRAAAAEHEASAVAFVPREGGRFVRLLTGDVALSLVTGTDRPVVALPAPDDE